MRMEFCIFKQKNVLWALTALTDLVHQCGIDEIRRGTTDRPKKNSALKIEQLLIIHTHIADISIRRSTTATGSVPEGGQCARGEMNAVGRSASPIRAWGESLSVEVVHNFLGVCGIPRQGHPGISMHEYTWTLCLSSTARLLLFADDLPPRRQD